MKKVIFLILVVLLIAMSINVIADGDRQSGLFSYQLKGNGTAVITGFDWDANGSNDIYVPRFIDGYSVTEIGSFAFSDEEITKDFDSFVNYDYSPLIINALEKYFWVTRVTQL